MELVEYISILQERKTVIFSFVSFKKIKEKKCKQATLVSRVAHLHSWLIFYFLLDRYVH
jgi:hypothetical protein